MKKSGAQLAVHALEQIGVEFTFGVPGVHNTELYDELGKSERIQPILVTHELCGAFMADAVSRTGNSIGTLAIVPAAGTTHAMSGIGEAFLDGIPMLVVSGGVRRDTGRSFQLHQLDQTQLVQAVTKKAFVVRDHAAIVPTLYEAYNIAVSGTPGPVFVELPVELQMFRKDVGSLPRFEPPEIQFQPDPAQVAQAAELLKASRRPALYVGWGARDCLQELEQVAELLAAPVSTTLQGLSVFPASHPLHAGMGFGHIAVPAAEKAFRDCDCLLAAGVRFSELATGSYSLPVPEKLIHIDINEQVFSKNYPAAVAIRGDAGATLRMLLDQLRSAIPPGSRDAAGLRQLIRAEKKAYLEEWTRGRQADRVNPARFFQALRMRLADDAILCVDDGNHTFLSAELFPVRRPKSFISPTDFNAMGYCVPAAIGAKLANPDRQVAGIVGDGAFLMTGMETLTANAHRLGIAWFVFNDGELGQISQFQKIPLNRKTCTVLAEFKLEGMARATGLEFFSMDRDDDIERVIDGALAATQDGKPALVDVRIDYSRKTRFTRGVVKTNLSRFSTREKIRFIGRAIKRHTLG